MNKLLDCPFRGEGILREGFSSEHPGVDFALPPRTPITAVASGRVSFIRVSKEAPFDAVEITHSDDLTSVYSGLDRVIISIEESISQGQIIGFSACSHINPQSVFHFQLLSDRVPLDPLSRLEDTKKCFSEREAFYRVKIPRLTVRSGPSADFSVIGFLNEGAIVLGEDPAPDTWIQIGHNAFIPLRQKGVYFCERVSDF